MFLSYLVCIQRLIFSLKCLFQYTDEEVERCYEEFYEDVHTEFLKFGELVNFKVSKLCFLCLSIRSFILIS